MVSNILERSKWKKYHTVALKGKIIQKVRIAYAINIAPGSAHQNR